MGKKKRAKSKGMKGSVEELTHVPLQAILLGNSFKHEDSDDEDLEHADNVCMMSSLSDSAIAQAASEVGDGGMGFIWSTNEGTSADDDDVDINKNFNDDIYQNFDDDDEDIKQYFDSEVLATLERYESEYHDDNDIILQVKFLRLMSCNLITADCAGAVFYSIMKLAIARDHTSSGELCTNAETLITKWKKVLRNYLPTMDEEIEVIMKFEELCESEKEYADLDAPLISGILYHLYNEDIIQEEAVMKWASEKEGADESDKIFLRKAEPFIKWLKEAPEEEE